jgi:hypothetical protein
LRFELFRESRKQLRRLKLPVLAMPQVVYNVTVRLNVPGSVNNKLAV